MIYVDTKYISLVSGRLDKFSKKNENLFNFRCPYCGDSQKNRNRARGYFYRHKGSFIYKCHNCGVGRTLSNFLKDQDPDLYGEYVMEAYREGSTGKGTKIPLTGSLLYLICASTSISFEGASIETQLISFIMASLLKRSFLFAT